jgi:hypothetical protein
VLGLAAGTAILAAPSGGYSIPWWTLDGGGRTSSGDSFSLSGTAGQPDAGVLSAGAYELTGGFWNSPIGGISGGAAYKLLLPLTVH